MGDQKTGEFSITREELLGSHGKRAVAIIDGARIFDAKISVSLVSEETRKAHLCHNDPSKKGDQAPDRLGYDYSWLIFSDTKGKTLEDSFYYSNINVMYLDLVEGGGMGLVEDIIQATMSVKDALFDYPERSIDKKKRSGVFKIKDDWVSLWEALNREQKERVVGELDDLSERELSDVEIKFFRLYRQECFEARSFAVRVAFSLMWRSLHDYFSVDKRTRMSSIEKMWKQAKKMLWKRIGLGAVIDRENYFVINT